MVMRREGVVGRALGGYDILKPPTVGTKGHSNKLKQVSGLGLCNLASTVVLELRQNTGTFLSSEDELKFFFKKVHSQEI